ncbi:UNVERIFIED_CONTAM: FkbM family methyltransferase [Methylobacteriaceae bacterium AG10]|nr:FkbM family methyltransferase [Methylobacteriaceae bacterium AG10]
MAHDWRTFIRKGIYSGDERDKARAEFAEAIETNFIPHEVEPVSRFVQAGSGIVALDMGCNKGLWAKALLNHHKGNVDHIYMVDASVENVDECVNPSDNLVFEPDDFSKLTVSQFAVGDRNGVIDFFTNESGAPVGSIFPQTVAGEHPFEIIEGPRLDAAVVQVPLQTIDTYVMQHNIQRIDILKLDIEGNEWNALMGASDTFNKIEIDAVQFEFGAGQVEARNFFKDFYEFFKFKGYKLYKVCGEHFATHGDYLLPIERYGFHLERFDGAWNFVASKNTPRP